MPELKWMNITSYTTPGKVIFIPEEIHQISKDSSFKMVESGTFVTAGTEIIKDVRAKIDGIVEIKEFNDIILMK
ncbi:MAG: hypothetical protein MZU97_02260 [Bacillus subtilis]|nr:hypothetical protein [Bacillus subtilis]